MGGDGTFGAVLRRHRRQVGLSQEELAARAFVSTRAISDLERGVNARPRLHTAMALADGLGLDDRARREFERFARADDLDTAAPTPTVAAHARVPLTVDSFVDDGTNLVELLRVVQDRRNRLVTLIGPGGVGKTRLALEMAHRLRGPVAFVALASVSDAALVVPAVIDALGADHGPTRTHLQSLVDHLASRALTLVLDNLEQIVAAAGDISVLLRSCPALAVVATSRVPLRVAGEVQFAVRPLAGTDGALDPPPGVRLFLERAAATGSAIASDTELDAVAELCRRLDGLPLAIELAAARSRTVTPSEVLRHLDSVLDLLSGGRSDAPPQHRSMRAALEWSYRLLAPDAQQAFAALGVFATSASTDAAMAVWGVAPSATTAFFDLAETLADAHLVTIERATDGTGSRIDLFEITRQFARQKLDEGGNTTLVEQRLAQWAVDLVGRAEPELNGTDQLGWLALLDRELPNLRAVVAALAEQGTPHALDTRLRLVAGLPRYFEIRSRWHEAAALLRDALATPGGSPAMRAKAYKALGVMHRCVGDLTAAEAELERSVELYASAGDELGMASCLNNRGVIALDRTEYARADALFREALAVCEQHGEERMAAIVLNNLGLTSIEAGGRLEAFRRCRRSRELLLAQGNVAAMGWSEDNLASALTLAGHPGWAVPIHERTTRRRLELGDENGLTWSLEALAAAWTATGQTDLAGRLLGFVAAHRRRVGTVPVPHLTALTARRSAALVARIGQQRFAELWAEGEALDPQLVRAWFID